MKDKKSLKNLMRREGREGREVAGTPRVVHSARSHQTVTDTERLQERNVRRGGKVRRMGLYTVHCTDSSPANVVQVLFEKIKTEEHEVYNSGDSETSDDEADFVKIEYEELNEDEPLEYKTRTEESFIEYFKKGEVGQTLHTHTLLSLIISSLCSMFCFNKSGG